MIDSSPGAAADRSSYPSCSEPKPEATSSPRDSPVESEAQRVTPSLVPRKAYMDLNEAAALLDALWDPIPLLRPLTPRTPLTPHPRNKRARSKSSENSSNYSNERLSERSFEKEVKEKKRPFLKKIGASMTEDKPFLAKLAPRIIGKPYLEKIGPSKAVEKPFLEKIGSSKTLDKFFYDTFRYEKRSDEGATRKSAVGRAAFDVQRRKSSKGPPLLKMYSFETEDLESTVQPKETARDPLRGASLDDVLDSGPSSLPLETTTEESTTKESPESKPNDRKERVRNGVELLKCRVTTSEEIIFTNTSFGSDKEPNSWGNSPRSRWKRDVSTPRTHARRRIVQNKSRDSVPNSPTKRPISTGREEYQADSSEKNLYSPLKTRRQTYEDIAMDRDEGQDEKPSKQPQFERRGISSDNLLPNRTMSTVDYQARARSDETREASSEDSLRTNQEYTKETFKQLQDKFRCREIPTETYADFKRRTRGNLEKSIIARQQEMKANESLKDTKSQAEELKKDPVPPEGKEPVRVRSVLKKQQGIDHLSDQESDTNSSSVRRNKRRILHELSQETTDLLTELRKVKSLLKTPSWEKDFELDKKPVRQAKRILLTDKEFCLSVERENSIRRPSRVIDSFDNGKKPEERAEESESKVPGPALFEKKCLSLDYADDEKPAKPEVRAISLASTRNLPSGTVEQLACDTKSYSSDVFNTPSDETNETKECDDSEKDVPESVNQNHCAEIDIAIPIDQKSSPKGIQIQGRTSDLYEIISPRSTPFRVRKKRLGKISVEESIKPESFTLGSKVDCRSTVIQKRTKCFPL